MILSYVSGFDSREQHPPVAGSRDKEECMMDVQQPLRSASVAPSSVFSRLLNVAVLCDNYSSCHADIFAAVCYAACSAAA